MDARTSGRNDILIDGKKVSGNAFYHLPQRSIVHGTMLYDTNLEHMARATTPSDAKLKSKGVDSVRQHVTTLNRYISLSIDEFKNHLRTALCNGEYMLTVADVAAIEDIEKEYYTPEFIYGNNPAYTLTKEKRIEGVGEFRVSIDVKEGVIRKVNLAGDFFIVGDMDTMLLGKLKGVRLEREAVDIALDDVDCASVIMNMTKEQLINLLTD